MAAGTEKLLTPTIKRKLTDMPSLRPVLPAPRGHLCRHLHTCARAAERFEYREKSARSAASFDRKSDAMSADNTMLHRIAWRRRDSFVPKPLRDPHHNLDA